MNVSLLDYLTLCMGSCRISDLRVMNQERKCEMAFYIEPLSASDASVEEWNDALQYLTGGAPRKTAEEGKAALCRALTGK